MSKKFSEQEIRALVFLLPLIAAMVWMIVSFSNRVNNHTELVEAASQLTTADSRPEAVAHELFTFDPNTASYEEFRRLGLDKQTAANIIKYRTAGKVFRIAEDLATCYGMTDSLFLRLRPYISIGDSFAIKPHYALTATNAYKAVADRPAPKADPMPTQPFDPNEADTVTFMRYGFTARQARTIVNYRESCGGFRDVAHFGRCYAVSDEMLERLRPLLVFDSQSESATFHNQETVAITMPSSSRATVEENETLVELNSADSLELVGVNGIGAWSASEIMKYRKRLGGFAEKEQLLDLKAVTEENYRKICEQIWIDSCKIQKIDINFASPKSMAEHPYMTPARVRKILKHRKLKGGWSTIEEMTEENILTEEEARKLAPYLQFVQKRP